MENHQAQRLFLGASHFIAGAASSQSLLPMKTAEIAFFGRSNVGKSALLNALTNRRALARTSHRPGRTRQLNFFSLPLGVTLVDVPGYGYAAISRQARMQWGRLVDAYLKDRASVLSPVHTLLVCVVVDMRHGTKPLDNDAFNLLAHYRVPFIVALTKMDCCTMHHASTMVSSTTEQLAESYPVCLGVLGVSSTKKQGIEALRMACGTHLGLIEGNAMS